MSEPRIILFDLETIPDLNAALDVWPSLSNYPGLTFKASINSICCFGYKVFGDNSGAKIINAWDFPEWESNVNDDRPLLRAAYEILKDADAFITQNGKRFDEPVIQTRLLLRDMDTLSKIRHVDTKLLAKKFSFFSNSLKYLAEQLTERRKIENEGWRLWTRTHGGLPRVRDPEAERTMAEYCKGDVEALEAIYLRLRSASTGNNSLPNFNLHQMNGSENLCPGCGSTRIFKDGIRYNATVSYQRYVCKDCGAKARTDLSNRMPRLL